MPEPAESDPAAPLPETLAAPPNRASITPTIRSGGGIVTGSPKAGPNNGRTVSQPSDLQQARPVVLPGMSSREISGIQHVSEARKLLERGRIIEARAALESAISLLPSAALHELGRTFDPYYLGLLPSIDEGSEPRRAAALYQEAIVYGSPTAGIDLNRLKASHPSLR